MWIKANYDHQRKVNLESKVSTCGLGNQFLQIKKIDSRRYSYPHTIWIKCIVNKLVCCCRKKPTTSKCISKWSCSFIRQTSRQLSMYWVGQKVCSDCSITWYGKTQMSFLVSPLHYYHVTHYWYLFQFFYETYNCICIFCRAFSLVEQQCWYILL